MSISRAHFILYVGDQGAAASFYRRTLDLDPILDVPGMTEFPLGEESILGLMPAAGAERLLGRTVVVEHSPRAELYLMVDDPAAYHERAISVGATETSAFAVRDWGHEAAYSIDPWGNVIAFAKAI